MPEPWTFTIEPGPGQVFTFSNSHVTFAVDTQFLVPTPPALPESVTVESVALTTPQDTHELGIHDVVVPAPVVGHVAPHFFHDLLI
jgi:hypothetical protein